MVQQQQSSIINVPIVWRGQKIELELSSEASLRVLGEELLKLTQVKPETMKLIVPQSSMKGSILLVPFSEEHSSLRLKDTGIIVGKPLRMMGVPENEVDEILKDAKLNLRIAGFEEEEQRMKGRLSRRPQSLKLPQGPYIFCDFRTLELPGIQLNPPPSEALKRMHMLAADPGIIAIMNKHRWRVGIMTEMAPVGYVGISPTCLLGLNKNHGEEISLRLRTDDLKGFRKYETIKKTLLHELAHMVFSEHDESFYALNKQLNQEASALDWTRSKKHTLADTHYLGHDDVDVDFEIDSHLPQKLGGETSLMSGGARAASIAAAYHRLTDSSTSPQNSSELDQISDDNTTNAHGSWSSVGTMVSNLNNGDQHHGSDNKDMLEPDPDDSDPREAMILRPCLEVDKGITLSHDLNAPENLHTDETGIRALDKNLQEEPDPDGSKVPDNAMVVDTGLVNFQPTHVENNAPTVMRSSVEPDTDDDECINNTGNFVSADQIIDSRGVNSELSKVNIVLDAKTPQENDTEREASLHSMDSMADEPDPDDEELKRIQDPVIVFCDRLTKAIDMLRNDLNSSEAMIVQQTLFKIIRNVSENPDEMKYKRLHKANPAFQKNIANYKVMCRSRIALKLLVKQIFILGAAAVEILSLVGFTEELITDDMGKAEIYLVLKRNDPGLLWLAKSSLETTIPK